MKKQPTVEALVYVIDDDASVRDSFCRVPSPRHPRPKSTFLRPSKTPP